MSSIYRIHGSRFIRKYTADEKTSCYSYMADVSKIANTLCMVPWEMVKSDVAATTTIHTEEGLDWNATERDRFDAAEWCGEHSEGYHRAYAQAACYVFKMPASAVGKAIEKIKVRVNSDPYNPYGARIAAKVSSTLTIPMDCNTVRTGDVYRAPDSNGLGAAPRLYVNNANGTQTWYANSEDVELTPTGTLAAGAYLFVFVCLENYNRGRDGWIEGSSYIENDVELTLSAAASDFDANELNDCRISGVPAELKLVNLMTGATDATIQLSGPVHSMAELCIGESTDGRIAVITGDFDEYAISGMPGLVVYDYDTRSLVSVSEMSGHAIPSGMKAAIRNAGVKAYANTLNGIAFQFDYVPESYIADTRIGFEKSGGSIVAAAVSASLSLNDSKVKNELTVAESATTGMIVYNDRITLFGDTTLTLDKSGTLNHVSGGFCGAYGFVVSGNNKISGVDSAVKFIDVYGNVKSDGLVLTPDNFEDFKAINMRCLLGAGGDYSDGRMSDICFEGGSAPLIKSVSESRRFPMCEGKMLMDFRTWVSNHNTSPVYDQYVGTVATIDGKTGYLIKTSTSSSGNTTYHNYEMYIGADSLSGCSDENIAGGSAALILALTGRFKSIGGLAAEGAMIFVIKETHSTTGSDGICTHHVAFEYVPLKLGEVRNMCLFTNASSRLPMNLSHALVDLY